MWKPVNTTLPQSNIPPTMLGAAIINHKHTHRAITIVFSYNKKNVRSVKVLGHHPFFKILLKMQPLKVEQAVLFLLDFFPPIFSGEPFFLFKIRSLTKNDDHLS